MLWAGWPLAQKFALSIMSVLLDEIYRVEWQRMRLRNDQRLEEWPGIAAVGS